MRSSTMASCESACEHLQLRSQLTIRSFTVGDQENALVHIAAVLDPVSTSAQQWSGLLSSLAKLDNVAVSVYMEPETHVTEASLQSVRLAQVY